MMSSNVLPNPRVKLPGFVFKKVPKDFPKYLKETTILNPKKRVFKKLKLFKSNELN